MTKSTFKPNIISKKIVQAYSMDHGIIECAARTGLGKTYQTGVFSASPNTFIQKTLDNTKDNTNSLIDLLNQDTLVVYLAHQKLPCEEIVKTAIKEKGLDFQDKFIRIMSSVDSANNLLKEFNEFNKDRNQEKYSLAKDFFVKNNNKFIELSELFNNYRDAKLVDFKGNLGDRILSLFKTLKTNLSEEINLKLENIYNSKEIVPFSNDLLCEYVNVKIIKNKKALIKKVKCDKRQIDWLKPFYIQAFWDSFSLIALTYDMLLERGSSYYEGRKKYLELIQNSSKKVLIVFDEADSAPAILYRNLIKRSENLIGGSDFFSLMTNLNNVLNHQDPYPYDQSKNKKQFNESLDSCKKQWEKYFSDIKFNVSLLATDLVKKEITKNNINVNFIFKDPLELYSLSEQKGETYYLCFTDSDGPAYLLHKKELKTYETKYEKGVFFEIKDFLRKSSKTINFFSTVVFNSGLNYIDFLEQQKNNKKSTEQNIQTLCSLYQISEGLKNIIHQARESWVSKSVNFSDARFYEKGFELFHIEATDDAAPAKIKRYKLATTAEKILLELSKKHPILLLSATCNVPYITNFDLNYLKNKLNNHYLEWTKLDNQEAQESDPLFNLPFEIKTDFIKESAYKGQDEDSDTYALDQINEFIRNQSEELNKLKFSSLAEKFGYSNKLCTLLRKHPEEKKHANQYMTYLSAIIRFREENISSALLLFQRGLDRDLCQKLTKETIKFIPDNKKEVLILKANAEDLRDKTQQSVRKIFSEEYKNGKDVYLISTFGTMNKAVNFEFDIRDNEDENVSFKSFKRTKKRSFQGIFVSSKRYYFATGDRNNITFVNGNIPISYETLSQIIDAYKAYNFDCISYKQCKEVVKQSILKNEGLHSLKKEILIGKLKAYSVFETINQSFGRLTRGNYYSKKMLVMTTFENADSLQEVFNFLNYQNFSTTPILNAIMENSTNALTLISNLSKEESAKELAQKLENSSYFYKGFKMRLLKRIAEGIKNKKDTQNEITFFDNYLGACLYLGPFVERQSYNNFIEENSNNEILINALNLMYVDAMGRDIKNGIYYKEINDYSSLKVSFKKVKELTSYYSPTQCNIQTFLNFPNFIDFVKKENISCNFEIEDNKEYKILNPYAYNNTYKGRLGEAFGNFLFQELGQQIDRIVDNEVFELADYEFVNDKTHVIDFKNYKVLKSKKEEFLKTLYYKIQHMDIKKYSIINVRPVHSKDIKIDIIDELVINGEKEKFLNINKEPVKIYFVQATYFDNNQPRISLTFAENFLNK